jgi:hypothetical protein
VFWFWFWRSIDLLMFAGDAIWWVVALRLVKSKRGRDLVNVFMAAQMTGHVLLVSDVDWPRHTPMSVFIAVFIWHYFGLALGAAIILWIVLKRLFAQMARGVAWLKTAGRKENGTSPVATGAAIPPNANLVARRKFIGTCAAFTPALFTIGLTGVAQFQLNHFRVRRFTLGIPTLPRDLDGLTIAHVSDIHVGELTSTRMLRQMVESTNELRPDLVLLTGDLINYHLADLSEGIALVKEMQGRHGL